MQALRNDAQLVFRETEKKEQRFKEQQIFAFFLISIFSIVFYVNIQPSGSKIRTEYFNIRIILLIRDA